MSEELVHTINAAASLVNQQYHIMRISGANQCNVSSQATDSDMCGVLLNKPGSGEGASIKALGLGKVVAGAAITAGDHLTCNGSGRGITVTSGSMALGQALETAGADGDMISIVQYYPVRWAGAP